VSEDELRYRFSQLPEGLTESLLKISRDARKCPMLIWLQGGRIRSVHHAEFTVGINFTVQCWKLTTTREIKIKKELDSPNGFLSLVFAEGQTSPVVPK
jgi:hypothetical protein